jgi:hypothetical protein
VGGVEHRRSDAGERRAHLTSLSTTVLIWLEKQYSCRPSVLAVMETLPSDFFMSLCNACPSGSVNWEKVVRCEAHGLHNESCAHPEVDVELAASADLIRDGHLQRR